MVDYPDYRLSYLNKTVQMVFPGRNHERIATVITTLVNAYCRKYSIPYYTLGNKDIEKKFIVGK